MTSVNALAWRCDLRREPSSWKQAGWITAPKASFRKIKVAGLCRQTKGLLFAMGQKV